MNPFKNRDTKYSDVPTYVRSTWNLTKKSGQIELQSKLVESTNDSKHESTDLQKAVMTHDTLVKKFVQAKNLKIRSASMQHQFATTCTNGDGEKIWIIPYDGTLHVCQLSKPGFVLSEIEPKVNSSVLSTTCRKHCDSQYKKIIESGRTRVENDAVRIQQTEYMSISEEINRPEEQQPIIISDFDDESHSKEKTIKKEGKMKDDVELNRIGQESHHEITSPSSKKNKKEDDLPPTPKVEPKKKRQSERIKRRSCNSSDIEEWVSIRKNKTKNVALWQSKDFH